MNKIKTFLAAFTILAISGCTNMNPNVMFDPKADSEAYCAIGKKDSKVASQFWNKVETAYLEKMMYAELEEFERLIIENSQAAALEKPARDAAKAQSAPKAGEISYYPEEDAQSYITLMDSDQKAAEQFYEQVVKEYNNDGLYEDLEIFKELCETQKR